MLATQASAEDNSGNTGEMEWQIDRITENNSETTGQSTETELEQTFPDLFAEETIETIETTQANQETALEDLEQTLFQEDIGENSIIQDTRESLFGKDYTAPALETDENANAEQGSTWLDTALLIGLAALVVVVLGGIFGLIRKLAD